MQPARAYHLGMLCVAALIGVAAIGISISMVVSHASAEELASLLTIPFLFSLAIGTWPQRGWRGLVGLAAAAASVVMLLCFALGAMNVDLPGGKWAEILAIIGTVASLLPGLACLLWQQKLQSTAGRWLRRIAIALAALAAFVLVVVVYLGPGVFSNPAQPWTEFSIISIVWLAASLLMLPFVDRGFPPNRDNQRISQFAVKLTCPRCGSEQTLGTGGDRCSACGLAVQIEVESPRCRCGYLLIGIAGDACPECGRNARGKSWPTASAAAVAAIVTK